MIVVVFFMMKELAGDDAFGYSVACCCGIAVSLYALWVEVQKHRNPAYVAVCDLGENMKCSRVLTSESVHPAASRVYSFYRHSVCHQ